MSEGTVRATSCRPCLRIARTRRTTSSWWKRKSARGECAAGSVTRPTGRDVCMPGWNEHLFEADKELREGLSRWDAIQLDIFYAVNPSVWAPGTFSVDELVDLTGGSAQSIELVSCRPDSAQAGLPRIAREPAGPPFLSQVLLRTRRASVGSSTERRRPVRGNGRSPAWSASTTPPNTRE